MTIKRVRPIARTQAEWNRDTSESVNRAFSKLEAATTYQTLTVADVSSSAIPDAHPSIISLCQQNNGNHVAAYAIGGGGAALLGTSGGSWDSSTTTPASGKASVAWSGSDYTLYNNTGTSITVSYQLFALNTGS